MRNGRPRRRERFRGIVTATTLITVAVATVAALGGCVGPVDTGNGGGAPLQPLAYPREAYWAHSVVEVNPGAGQHANGGYALVPAHFDRVLGPPEGKGTAAAEVQSIVSVHGPGASITLRFVPPLEDHPANIGGYDFIVFGNAIWPGGNPQNRFQEPGSIEVMKDENGNGAPDDTWYLIPGSELDTSSTPTSLTSARNDPAYYPVAEGHPAGWYPDAAVHPGFPDTVTHTFYEIAASKAGNTSELVWGYLDVSPTLKLGDMSGADGAPGDNSLDDPEDLPAIDPVYFYTVPDTHGDRRIDPGSGGGDAVDIAWAVDPATWDPAGLDSIDFIRITNAVKHVAGVLGDIDAELDAVARVRRE